MPCPFTGPKMLCASPNFFSQPKNLTAFSASSKTFVLVQKPILQNAKHLLSGTTCLWLALNAVKFLGWLKKFGPAQNFFGPLKGQGISHFGSTKMDSFLNFNVLSKTCYLWYFVTKIVLTYCDRTYEILTMNGR